MRRLLERYRLPEQFLKFDLHGDPTGPQGFFKLGKDVTCFGACAGHILKSSADAELSDARSRVTLAGDTVHLPFDPDQVVDNLLLEKYLPHALANGFKNLIHSTYYSVRPSLPAPIRQRLQRLYLSGWENIAFPGWPLDDSVERILEFCLVQLMKAQKINRMPFIWFWPDTYESCAVVTHDVESEKGKAFCTAIMDMNDASGIKSQFFIVPETRYSVPPDFLNGIRSRGFDIGVHDLNHDGHLFVDEKIFKSRVATINQYGKSFGAAGFRAGALYRNHAWSQALRFEYDMSTPNVAHLEPQRGGCCTVFPYANGALLELPLTLTQDYAVFNFLREFSVALWKKQIDLVRAHHGLISLLVHPDYIIDERPQAVYRQMLHHLVDLRDRHNVWITLPRNVNAWWRTRAGLRLVSDRSDWRIEGEGSERATVAWACLDGDRITYQLAAQEQLAVGSRQSAVGSRQSAENKDESAVGSGQWAVGKNESAGGRGQWEGLSWQPAAGSGQQAVTLQGVAASSSQQAVGAQDLVPAESHSLPSEPVPAASCQLPAAHLGSSTHSTDPRDASVLPAATCQLPAAHPDSTTRKPLNVAMLAYTHYESDTRVIRYAETLAHRGDCVEVIALRQFENEPDATINGVHVRKIQTRLRNEKTKTDFAVRLVAFLLRSLWLLYRQHRRHPFDLIHVHSVPDFLVLSAWLPRLTGAKVILDIHDVLPEFYASKFTSGKHTGAFKLLVWVERVSARMADHVIIANDLWRERLIRRSVQPEKCSTLLNYPDTTVFKFTNKKPLPQKGFVFLYPGSLNWHQGLDIAIHAFAKIKDRATEAKFCIYGYGPEKERLLQLTRDLDLNGRVQIHDPVTVQEIAPIMGAADVAVVPKRSDTFGNEAFSTKTLEFMSLGVPVIVADTAIDKHYFNDSVVRFFPSGNVDALAEAMLDLANNSALRQRLANNGLTFAEAYSWENHQQIYLDMVDGLCVEGHSRQQAGGS